MGTASFTSTRCAILSRASAINAPNSAYIPASGLRATRFWQVWAAIAWAGVRCVAMGIRDRLCPVSPGR
jgi:hypothetical protein